MDCNCQNGGESRQRNPLPYRRGMGASNTNCRGQMRNTDRGCMNSSMNASKPMPCPEQHSCRPVQQQSCQPKTRCPENPTCITCALRATERMPVGMTYTPYQEFIRLYEPCEAICRGTIFCDLDKPFLMTNCQQGGGRV